MSENLMQQLRNSYFLGYYHKCMDLMKTGIFDTSSEEFISFALRTRLEIEGITASQISQHAKNSNPTIKSLALLSELMKMEQMSHRATIIKEIEHLSKTPDLTCRFICASALAYLGEDRKAINICENGSIEMLILKSMIFFKLGKYEALHADENSFDEDEVLGKLAIAWSCIAEGSYKEAYLTFGDIHSLFTDNALVESEGSAMILNAKAICNMYRKLWNEALEDLKKAFILNSNNSDTLANLICCYRNLGKYEEADNHLKLLQKLKQNHFFITKQIELEELMQKYITVQDLNHVNIFNSQTT